MKKILFLLISSLITLYSCYSDKGNYDYVDINVVSILNGEDSVYNVVSKIDTVRIYPKLLATLDPNMNTDSERYSYKWSISDEYTSKDLIYPVDLASGSYKFTLTLTDNSTKLVTKAVWIVNVSDLYQKGFIVLTENENNEAMLDMISLFKDSVVLKNVTKHSGMPILKNPRGLFLNTGAYSNDEIFIYGENNTYKLHPTKFTYNSASGNLKDNFLGPGLYSDFNVTDIVSAKNARGMRFIVVDGNVFNGNEMGTILFDFPFNRYSKKYTTYKVADKIAVNYEYASDYDNPTNEIIMMYNTDENRFVFRRYGLASQLDSINDTKLDVSIFSWKTGLTFVTTAHSYFGNGDNFTILKDNVGGYFLYQYLCFSTARPAKKGKYNISDAPGIANAKFFCFSANQPFFFYSSGSKIYGYDYYKNNKTFEMEMGAEVTCLYDNPKFEGGKDFIYIATYGGTPNSGKLVKKHIINNPNTVGLEDPIGANSKPQKVEFTGFNKIIDVIYKDR